MLLLLGLFHFVDAWNQQGSLKPSLFWLGSVSSLFSLFISSTKRFPAHFFSLLSVH
ncbi:hypothetical protein KP509_02G103100 [Ceratopteris richardii]|uniref:Uncharacterized protein n=1 Tax=Ceratopteris richardii TaxID=49495 RepID=A0A8T2VD88_CERRI|nr:hypothetical protein KP509_02G103100 [Ceratopteris richardii]